MPKNRFAPSNQMNPVQEIIQKNKQQDLDIRIPSLMAVIFLIYTLVMVEEDMGNIVKYLQTGQSTGVKIAIAIANIPAVLIVSAAALAVGFTVTSYSFKVASYSIDRIRDFQQNRRLQQIQEKDNARLTDIAKKTQSQIEPEIIELISRGAFDKVKEIFRYNDKMTASTSEKLIKEAYEKKDIPVCVLLLGSTKTEINLPHPLAQDITAKIIELCDEITENRDKYKCPITLEIITHPIFITDNGVDRYYEESSISQVKINPITGKELISKDIKEPNDEFYEKLELFHAIKANFAGLIQQLLFKEDVQNAEKIFRTLSDNNFIEEDQIEVQKMIEKKKSELVPVLQEKDEGIRRRDKGYDARPLEASEENLRHN